MTTNPKALAIQLPVASIAIFAVAFLFGQLNGIDSGNRSNRPSHSHIPPGNTVQSGKKRAQHPERETHSPRRQAPVFSQPGQFYLKFLLDRSRDAVFARLEGASQDDVLRLLTHRTGLQGSQVPNARIVIDALVQKLAGFPDKEKSLQYLIAHRHLNDFRERLVADFIRQWARMEPDAAYERAARIRHRLDKGIDPVDSAWQTILEHPQSALDFLDRHPERSSPGRFAEVAGVWNRLDTEAAKQWAATLEAGAERDAVEAAIRQSLSATDPQEWFKEQAINASGKERGDVFDAWAERDPEQAFAWLSSEQQRADHEEMLTHHEYAPTLRGWLKRKPEAAANYLLGMTQERLLRILDGRPYIVEDLVDALTGLGAGHADQWLANQPEKVRDRGIFQLAKRAVEAGDLDHAFELAESMELSIRSEIHSTIAVALFRESPDEAVSFVNSLNGGFKRSAIADLSHHLGTLDPDRALALISAFPENSQPVAFAAAMGQLGKRAPQRAADYIDSYLNSGLSDRAVKYLARRSDFVWESVQRWFYQDSSAATDWLLRLPIKELRTPALLNAYKYLLMSNPTAAADARKNWPLKEADWKESQAHQNDPFSS